MSSDPTVLLPAHEMLFQAVLTWHAPGEHCPDQGLVLLGRNHHGGLGSVPALHRKWSLAFYVMVPHQNILMGVCKLFSQEFEICLLMILLLHAQ